MDPEELKAMLAEGNGSRITPLGEIRAVDESKRRLRMVATNEAPDEYNTIIRVDGWELDAFWKNPVFMYAHDSRGLPIGTVKALEPGTIDTPEHGKVKALFQETEFPDRATYPFGNLVYRMYVKGFLRGNSVGFDILKETIIEDEKELKDLGLKAPIGAILEKNRLREISAAPMPGNVDATIVQGELCGFAKEMRMTSVRIATIGPDADERQRREWLLESMDRIRLADEKAGASAADPELTARIKDMLLRSGELAGKPEEPEVAVNPEPETSTGAPPEGTQADADAGARADDADDNREDMMPKSEVMEIVGEAQEHFDMGLSALARLSELAKGDEDDGDDGEDGQKGDKGKKKGKKEAMPAGVVRLSLDTGESLDVPERFLCFFEGPSKNDMLRIQADIGSLVTDVEDLRVRLSEAKPSKKDQKTQADAETVRLIKENLKKLEEKHPGLFSKM